jgi:hypothetical protein
VIRLLREPLPGISRRNARGLTDAGQLAIGTRSGTRQAEPIVSASILLQMIA